MASNISRGKTWNLWMKSPVEVCGQTDRVPRRVIKIPYLRRGDICTMAMAEVLTSQQFVNFNNCDVTFLVTLVCISKYVITLTNKRLINKSCYAN